MKRPAIAGNYSGECKSGKVHGLGNTTITDSYKSEFKNGCPDEQACIPGKAVAILPAILKKV